MSQAHTTDRNPQAGTPYLGARDQLWWVFHLLRRRTRHWWHSLRIRDRGTTRHLACCSHGEWSPRQPERWLRRRL